jgi:lipid-A-disaccharide synthase
LFEAARQVAAGGAGRKVICMVAPSVAADVEAMAKPQSPPFLLVRAESEKADAFAAMEVALACSGTVTTELASQGAAVIVGYKLGWVTWALARLFLMRSRFITLLNVAAGREVAPEFVQTRMTAANLAAAAERLLSDPAALAAQRTGQAEALKLMAGPGRAAAEIAAETVLKLA